MCLRSYISRFSMSTAYLATSHFMDQDALSARIIQARFTGHFRFACQVPKRPNRAPPTPDPDPSIAPRARPSSSS